MKKFALISVYDKTNIEKICYLFKKYNITIISTGSTAKCINKIGYNCLKVSSLTKFQEILDGRVKTLHPLIHASLLFDRKNKEHVKQFNKLKFPIIDFVIVNLYPFDKINKNNFDKNSLINFIDIGGPALIRSAAKNYNFMTPIYDPKDYKNLLANMKKNNGKTSLDFRKRMAGKVFNYTSSYDLVISKWLNKEKILKSNFENYKKTTLRYGENPHQKSYFFNKTFRKNLFDNYMNEKRQLSHNNILDIDSAYSCINDFSEPTCAIIKHNNPCGVSSNFKIDKAFINAFEADPISAFGGILVVNRVISEKLAKLIKNKFFEILIAPKFSIKAKNIFKNKKKPMLLETKKIFNQNIYDIKSVNGGVLIQQKNNITFNKKNMKCVTKKRALIKQIEDLVFSYKVSKHVKSNSIVLVKNKKTVGIGAGQMSRIDSTKIALSKISSVNKRKGFVAASDAFFPFTDNINLLIKNNCKAIIQPSGSINDSKIIKFANKKKIPLYFSKYRFFKH